MTPLLDVQNLRKRFVLHHRNHAELQVLNGLTMQVSAGECVALHGQSGRGKSTLLRCLYGNYLVDSGHILLHHDGASIDIATAEARTILALRKRTIGYVSQFLRALPRIATLDVVAEPLVASRSDLTDMTDREHERVWDEAREQAAILLETLRLPSSLWQLPPATFSGGEQQRVNVARGLINRPALLLLDEPTASLDGVNCDVVMNLIQQARAAGSAVIGVFHDPRVRDGLADRLVEV